MNRTRERLPETNCERQGKELNSGCHPPSARAVRGLQVHSALTSKQAVYARNKHVECHASIFVVVPSVRGQRGREKSGSRRRTAAEDLAIHSEHPGTSCRSTSFREGRLC